MGVVLVHLWKSKFNCIFFFAQTILGQPFHKTDRKCAKFLIWNLVSKNEKSIKELISNTLNFTVPKKAFEAIHTVTSSQSHSARKRKTSDNSTQSLQIKFLSTDKTEHAKIKNDCSTHIPVERFFCSYFYDRIEREKLLEAVGFEVASHDVLVYINTIGRLNHIKDFQWTQYSKSNHKYDASFCPARQPCCCVDWLPILVGSGGLVRM